MELFRLRKRNEIRQLSTKLKVGANRAKTFTPSGEGDEQVVAYEVEKYTPIPSLPSFQRALMSVRLRNGETIGVVSAHETGEPVNAGSYEHQRDLAIQYATQEGVKYFEIDHDKVAEALKEIGKI